MSVRAMQVRLVFAVLFVALGAVILARGLAEGAPVSFTAMGAAMALLGVYRLRLMRAGAGGRR